ncbi:hypothetical protein MNBD_GAMMA05-1801 [hydrothermal vent metagenome]|uniref:Uncharacterized protein n=1 Tax=hydrothermal vent metagenome TaxID=652676 RepID=A0A3B0WQD0_9ZZZZ
MYENVDSNEIPVWVRWIAQDSDGAWWGYQAEPNLAHNSWYENEVGQCVRLDNGAANPEWISTIKQVKR